jgi:xanthine dehydrogenase YagS FAD-binding subunit
MKAFEYFKVTSVTDAVALLTQYGEKAALLAGGSDLLGMMKDSITGPKLKAPQYLISIKAIKGLSAIQEQKGGVRIGAAASITDISSSALLADRYPLLVQAAGQVAVPQIRNMATLGGNLCQRPRCWYFRGKLFKDCLRKGGDYCYAPAGENQYHAVLGAGSCHMVYPSDLAPALTALNARVEIAGIKGKRIVPIEQFYVHPDKNVLKENILTPQEMIVAVEIPASVGAKGIYLKLKERQAFDFAVVSVAVNLSLKNDSITEARVVLGGVAPIPFRSVKAETVLKGKQIKHAVADAAREVMAGAQSLSGNGYKITAAQGLLEKALSSLG